MLSTHSLFSVHQLILTIPFKKAKQQQKNITKKELIFIWIQISEQNSGTWMEIISRWPRIGFTEWTKM